MVPEEQPQRYPGGDLPTRHPPPVPEPHLPQRQRADDDRRGLRPRVAARGDDQRKEEREDHCLGDLLLEGAHRRGGQHLPQKQRREPASALLHHRAEAHVEVGRVEGLHTAESLDFLGGLLLRHVEDVVDGDHPHQHAAGIGHRKRDPVVLLEHRHHLVATGGGGDAHQRGVVQGRDQLVRLGQHQHSQPDVVEEHALVVGDVDDVEGLDVLARARARSPAPAARTSWAAPPGTWAS